VDARATGLHGSITPKPLAFIVVHDGVGLQRWQWNCVNVLSMSNEATLMATAVNLTQPVPERRSFWQRLHDRAVTAGLDAFGVVEPTDHVPALPRLDARDLGSMGQVDFILDFSTHRTVSPSLRPPFGIWRVRLGDATEGELPTSRETARSAHVITVIVEATVDTDDRQRVLHSATIKTRRSQRATLAAVFDAASATCLGACRRLRSGQPLSTEPVPAPPDVPAPGPLRIIAGQLVRSARRATEVVLFKDIWSVGVIRGAFSDLLHADLLPTPSWRKVPDDGTFHADPFPLTVSGNAYVLFEKYDPAQKRGLIAGARLDEWILPAAMDERTAIDLGCHMSYPAVFTHEGQVYCAPETHVLGGLNIFKMGSDPWHWTPAAHILPDIPLIDATLVEHAGLWWLMATLSGSASDTDLHAWHASSPFGPWAPHRLNPVKSDVRSSRPAGNLIRLNNQLYRPAQDCAKGYGMAVVMHQIIHLDQDRFVERAVNRFDPVQTWHYPDGLHTFNVSADGVVIDAKQRTLRGLSPVRNLVSKVTMAYRRQHADALSNS
jgi:hypothetical protein